MGGNEYIQGIICQVCHNEIRGRLLRTHLLTPVHEVQRKFEPEKTSLPKKLAKEVNIIKLIFKVYRKIRTHEISGTKETEESHINKEGTTQERTNQKQRN